jgi:hypothetical protein
MSVNNTELLINTLLPSIKFMVENNIEYIWLLYIILVIIQLFCNIMAMKSLNID